MESVDPTNFADFLALDCGRMWQFLSVRVIVTGFARPALFTKILPVDSLRINSATSPASRVFKGRSSWVIAITPRSARRRHWVRPAFASRPMLRAMFRMPVEI